MELTQPFTIETILKGPCGSRNQHLEPGKKKRSKYGNVRVEFDGHTFDSIRERDHYIVLRALLLAGEISDLRMQVPYELNEGGTHSLKYLADFVYIEKGVEVVCDVKGFRTKTYLKKKKLMEQVHGIIIREV